MKSIVFIVPFFGHFNNYFDIWLNSCKHNPTINWIIFTDCMDEHSYPSNVTIVKTTFEELRDSFQSHFDFKISLEKPYKLCEYRPAYGDLFYDYIKDYDFWGYCDIDLIWGDIRKFITDEMLSQYEKVGNRGHCCLMRNNEKMRKAYLYESNSMVTHKDAFSSDLAYCFDEQKAFGKYCKESGVKSCDNFTFFDVSFFHDDYRIVTYESHIFEPYAHNVFEYNNGKLLLHSVKCGSDDMKCQEIMYAHFQKRKMYIDLSSSSYNHFLVYGNTFHTFQPLSSQDIVRFDPKSWHRKLYFKIMWKKIKAEYLHGNGVKYFKYPY